MRATKKEFENLFKYFIKQIDDNKSTFYLEHNSCYGGYMIEKELENGGVCHPFINIRLPKKEMVRALQFATSVLIYYKAKDIK